MKKFILILALSFKCFVSQAQCVTIQTCTSSLLVSVQFTSAQIGYAVGNDGVIIKTTNAGNTWTMQTIGTTGNLKSVFFTDDNNGYVISDNAIYKTTNGGTNWLQSNNGININLSSIYFTDANIGYVAGYKISPPLLFKSVYKTTNAGANWFELNVSNYNLRSLFFADSNTGYAGGDNGVIVKTTDAGINWTEITFSSIYSINLIYFISTSIGFAPGPGGIYKTTDGGNDWFLSNNGISGEVLSIRFINTDVGYAVGHFGPTGNWHSLIVKTLDGGANWIYQQHPFGTQGSLLNSVFYTDLNNGYAVGETWNANASLNMILKTTNGGSWVKENIKSLNHFVVIPNPAKNSITIDIKNIEKYPDLIMEISNIKGQLLIKQSFSMTGTDIDISKWSKGIYFVKVQSKEFVAVDKFLKE